MSDTGEAEVSAPAGNPDVLPKEVVAEIGSVKLFNKWSYEDVEIRDISLTYSLTLDYPALRWTDVSFIATTFKSEPLCTFPIQLADMLRNGFGRRNVRSWSASRIP